MKGATSKRRLPVRRCAPIVALAVSLHGPASPRVLSSRNVNSPGSLGVGQSSQARRRFPMNGLRGRKPLRTSTTGSYVDGFGGASTWLGLAFPRSDTRMPSTTTIPNSMTM